MTLVRSSLIGGKSLTRSESSPACTTAIFTLLSGWLSARTVRWNRPKPVEAQVDVAEEIGGGERRVDGVDLDLDVAAARSG